MPKTRSQWLIDQHQKVPNFKTVNDAHYLWKTLLAERDYRLQLEKSDSDKKTDAIVAEYQICDDIAEALIDIEATTGFEVAKKIEIAVYVVRPGGSFSQFEIALLESAGHDARQLQSTRDNARRKAETRHAVSA